MCDNTILSLQWSRRNIIWKWESCPEQMRNLEKYIVTNILFRIFKRNKKMQKAINFLFCIILPHAFSRPHWPQFQQKIPQFHAPFFLELSTANGISDSQSCYPNTFEYGLFPKVWVCIKSISWKKMHSIHRMKTKKSQLRLEEISYLISRVRPSSMCHMFI